MGQGEISRAASNPVRSELGSHGSEKGFGLAAVAQRARRDRFCRPASRFGALGLSPVATAIRRVVFEPCSANPVLAQLREGFEKSGANSPQPNRLEEPQGRIQFSSPHFSTVCSLHNIYYTLLFQGTRKATQTLPSPWCRQDLGAGVAVNSPSRTRASPATAPLESAPSSVQICFAFSLLPAAR